MNVCLTGIVCFRCEYPERGGFVTYMKAEQMNVVLDHISKRFVRFFAWSLNIEFYISPITFLATPPRVSPVSTQLH